MTVLTPRQILERLVAFPTVSRDSNLDLIGWVEGYLGSHGIGSVRVPNADGTKSALYAQGGTAAEGGVILSGHTDVVPVDGQDWTSDPFTLTERDGRLYGRGAVDMKGFDALAIWACVEAQRRGTARPVQLALSYDEEIGCTGAAEMIGQMAEHLPRAAAAIIGEPTTMHPVTGHKGGSAYDVAIHGYEIHSSLMDRGVSAIHEAARLIQWSNERNAENAAATPDAMAAMFDPPFTTLHVGQIEGGTAHNITAADCRFVMAFRCLPSEPMTKWDPLWRAEVARVEAAMQTVRPETRIEMSELFHVPALVPERDGAAEALARALTGDNGQHVVSFGTEAGHFQAAGYSAVVCGPGDIAQAHQPDEYIELSQFEAGLAFLERLLARLG